MTPITSYADFQEMYDWAWDEAKYWHDAKYRITKWVRTVKDQESYGEVDCVLYHLRLRLLPSEILVCLATNLHHIAAFLEDWHSFLSGVVNQLLIRGQEKDAIMLVSLSTL